MLEFVDTHCHIQSIGVNGGDQNTDQLWSKLDSNFEEVVSDAQAAGVNRLIVVGCTLEDSQLAIERAALHPRLWASIGIHPHEASIFSSNHQKQKAFELLASRAEVVAIGECGLDFYYNHSPKADQLLALRQQLELAVQYQLPVIFHVRQALDDFWPLFDELNSGHKIRGVLHSFTDSRENLDKALNRGLMLGVNGIATFSKDAAQLEMYKHIPLANLLLETDSPYLTPSPFRGTINKPKYVRIVAEFLANLRGEELDKIAAITTQNARQLFKI